jgi:hypothetical protein
MIHVPLCIILNERFHKDMNDKDQTPKKFMQRRHEGSDTNKILYLMGLEISPVTKT